MNETTTATPTRDDAAEWARLENAPDAPKRIPCGERGTRADGSSWIVPVPGQRHEFAPMGGRGMTRRYSCVHCHVSAEVTTRRAKLAGPPTDAQRRRAAKRSRLQGIAEALTAARVNEFDGAALVPGFESRGAQLLQAVGRRAIARGAPIITAA